MLHVLTQPTFAVVFLELGWSSPCDMWAVACVAIECYTGSMLFQTHEKLEHLAMMEVFIGKMPRKFRKEAAYVPWQIFWPSGRA